MNIIKKILSKFYKKECKHKNYIFINQKYSIKQHFSKFHFETIYGIEDCNLCKDCKIQFNSNFKPYKTVLNHKGITNTFNIRQKPKLISLTETEKFNYFIETGQIL